MLANDQIKVVAKQIDREAVERIGQDDDRFDRQQLWDAVRHACHAIEAVVELEHDRLRAAERTRRARYLVCELESALESARRARVALEWTARREEIDS